MPEVHIYHYVMNYWSNDHSTVSLQQIKDAITDLCDKKLIVSKNNSHISLGNPGVPENDQKNDSICIIMDAGRSYVKKIETLRKTRNYILVALLIALIYYAWHSRNMIKYFFR